MMEPIYVLVFNTEPKMDTSTIDFTAGFHYTPESAESWVKNNIQEEDQKLYEVRTLIYGLLPKHAEEAFYPKRKSPQHKEPNNGR